MQLDNAYTDPGLTVCLMQAALLFRYPAEAGLHAVWIGQAGLHAVRIDQAGLHAVRIDQAGRTQADQPRGDSS